MKAAVLYGKEDVRVEDIAAPALKPGEVRIQIEASLTCGTDLKVFKRGYHAKMIVPPAVFGHELSGVICETSPGARDESGAEWRVGERVVPANSAPCGQCFHCRNGQENICDDLLFLNGAYAETIAVPARIAGRNLLRLKPDTAFRDAALTEPLACVVQGAEDARLRSGQHVLVLGAGPIGLMFVAVARQIGCDVTVAGRGLARMEAARRLGARQVIDIGDGYNLVAKVREASQEHFDAVIEAVGQPAVWEASVHLVRKGGTVNFFGGCPAGTTVSLDTTLIHYSDLALLASFHHNPRTIRRALELIEAGVVCARDFVGGECALDALPELFKSMTAGNRVVKTLVRVRE